MYINMLRLRVYPAVVLATSMFGSVVSPVYADDKPRQQTFVVTAYYSAMPNQCCYFRGNYEDEITFNGKGVAGADGTAVYPGMIAGPDSYAFGTRIELPGIGVGTIHDRGGRIIEWGDDVHRIDLWMGYGEEGLARALAWGTRKVVGTVYPVGSGNMPTEHWSFTPFDSDPAFLASLPKTNPIDAIATTKSDDRSYGVRMLQNLLNDEGYLSASPNSYFGPATQDALKRFQADYGIKGEGQFADKKTSATLIAASSMKEKNMPKLASGLTGASGGEHVRQAQKLLRYLGYYRGRTDGVFDDNLRNSVVKFQLEKGVIADTSTVGTGTIGPSTKAAILKEWKVHFVQIQSETLLTKMVVASRVQSESVPAKLLNLGDRGSDVRRLQSFLVESGYMNPSDPNGNFGPKTKAALLQYQINRSIVVSETSRGAGVFGPSTRIAISKELVAMEWQDVRAEGL